MDKRRYPRLSLDLLRGFRVAARHLSFTRAAQELFVTQSAISREIKTLEEQIGQPLFHRVHRALQLTRAGEELYRAADDALTLLDGVTDRLAGTGKAIAVTTTSALASMWLAPRLPRFNSAHPGIGDRPCHAGARRQQRPPYGRGNCAHACQTGRAIPAVPLGREVKGEPRAQSVSEDPLPLLLWILWRRGLGRGGPFVTR